jgi:hypothetical protein
MVSPTKKMSIKISSKWHLIGLLKYFQNVFRLYQPFIMDYLTTKYEPMMSDHLQTRGGHIHKRPQMSFTMTYTSSVSLSLLLHYFTTKHQLIISNHLPNTRDHIQKYQLNVIKWRPSIHLGFEKPFCVH